uniref:Uncharacterized protein n=1 Tax=Solanum lycopersicum TaxID=4081 RepID=A0A3Q7G2C3_SOLLC
MEFVVVTAATPRQRKHNSSPKSIFVFSNLGYVSSSASLTFSFLNFLYYLLCQSNSQSSSSLAQSVDNLFVQLFQYYLFRNPI